MDELRGKLKLLGKARKRADAAKADYDALKDECKGYMVDNGLETLEVDGYQLDYKLVISTGVDVKALKAAMPELCAKFSKASESRRFTVTLPV